MNSLRSQIALGLFCRLGRCFCFAEVSTGDPHPSDPASGRLPLPIGFLQSNQRSIPFSFPNDHESEGTPVSGSFDDSDLTFYYQNTAIRPGDDMNQVLAAIGNASGVTAAPSCIGSGEDKKYAYSGFDIESYPAPNGETVMVIYVSDAGIKTAKGVSVGMTAADLTAAYGTPSSSNEYLISYAASGNLHLDFLMENGKIFEIDYMMDVT